VQVSVPKDTLVIRAAEQVGVQIPRFCHHPLLEPVTLALRPAHWESARVEAETAPRVLPASAALLDTQRPMDALLA